MIAGFQAPIGVARPGAVAILDRKTLKISKGIIGDENTENVAGRVRKGKFRGQGSICRLRGAHGRSLHSFILSPAGDIKRKHAAEIFFSPTCWVCSSCPVVWCLLLGRSSRPAGGDCRRARNSRGLEQSAVDFLPAFLTPGATQTQSGAALLVSTDLPRAPALRVRRRGPRCQALQIVHSWGRPITSKKPLNPSSPSGNLYVCGNTAGNATLYGIPITANAMGSASAMATTLSTSNTTCSEVTEIFKLPHRLDFSQRADRRQHQRQRWMPLRRRRLCDVFRRYQRPSNGERRAGRRSRGNQQHHRGQHAAVRHPGGRIAGLFFDFEQWYLRRGLRDPRLRSRA